MCLRVFVYEGWAGDPAVGSGGTTCWAKLACQPRLLSEPGHTYFLGSSQRFHSAGSRDSKLYALFSCGSPRKTNTEVLGLQNRPVRRRVSARPRVAPPQGPGWPCAH